MLNNKLRRLEIIDGILSKGKPVSFMDIAEELNKHFQLCSSKYSYSGLYGDNFRSDMKIIRDTIAENSYGIPKNMLMTQGGNRYKQYWYAEPGFRIMPYLKCNYTLADLKALDKALEILGDALPEDLFRNVEFALKSRIEYEFGREEKGIDYGENLSLKGRYWLPLIYKSLNKTSLTITYKPFSFSEAFSFTLHPYLLKQYNNRWFLFGKMENLDDSKLETPFPNKDNIDPNYWNVAIDRIETIVETKDNVFVPKSNDYLNHFNDIIGVTYKTYGSNSDVRKPYDIIIGVHNRNSWGNIITKPLHKSMTIIKDYTEGYGKISFKVIPNYDFYLEILKLGPNVAIEEPLFVREYMKELITQMREQYF